MTKPRGGEPLFLCFDTSGPHCAVALFEDDVPLATDFAEMRRGQGEALPPMVDAVMAKASVEFSDLTAIGVGVGPGNFTGIRISVSFARGLALGCDLRALSVSSFDLMKDMSGLGAESALLLSVPAQRDLAYVQLHRYGVPDAEPRLIDPLDPPDDLNRVNLRVRGYRAAAIGAHLNAPAQDVPMEDIPYRLGKITAWKWQNETGTGAPSPLYVRPPDAAPASDPPPVILP